MTDIFVSDDWLAENRGNDDVVVIDVRDGWDYSEGHIPGAVNLPFDDFRSPTEETPGKLPTPDRFSCLLEEAGVTRGDRLVAYDDEFGVYASRFLVTAEVFGHEVDRLHLLNCDFTGWKQDHSVTEDAPSIETGEYMCERVADGPLISAQELEEAIETDTVIVDTRDPIEFDTVHLPGAVNFQWRDLVDESRRRLKPDEEIRDVLSSHGITFERPVRLYCNTARRLSFVYAVLREMGHDDVGFYEGGIDEWADYGGPIETTI